MIDRKKLNECLGEGMTADQVAALVDSSLSTICDNVLDFDRSNFARKYPRLHEHGLV